MKQFRYAPGYALSNSMSEGFRLNRQNRKSTTILGNRTLEMKVTGLLGASSNPSPNYINEYETPDNRVLRNEIYNSVGIFLFDTLDSDTRERLRYVCDFHAWASRVDRVIRPSWGRNGRVQADTGVMGWHLGGERREFYLKREEYKPHKFATFFVKLMGQIFDELVLTGEISPDIPNPFTGVKLHTIKEFGDRLAATQATSTVKVYTGKVDIREAYTRFGGSCMGHEPAHYQLQPHEHPVNMYGNSKDGKFALLVAYRGDRPMARAIANSDTQEYSRVYGDHAFLRAVLKANPDTEGYTYDDNWQVLEGLEFWLTEPVNRVHSLHAGKEFLSPYIDCYAPPVEDNDIDDIDELHNGEFVAGAAHLALMDMDTDKPWAKVICDIRKYANSDMMEQEMVCTNDAHTRGIVESFNAESAYDLLDEVNEFEVRGRTVYSELYEESIDEDNAQWSNYHSSYLDETSEYSTVSDRYGWIDTNTGFMWSDYENDYVSEQDSCFVAWLDDYVHEDTPSYSEAMEDYVIPDHEDAVYSELMSEWLWKGSEENETPIHLGQIDQWVTEAWLGQLFRDNDVKDLFEVVYDDDLCYNIIVYHAVDDAVGSVNEAFEKLPDDIINTMQLHADVYAYSGYADQALCIGSTRDFNTFDNDWVRSMDGGNLDEDSIVYVSHPCFQTHMTYRDALKEITEYPTLACEIWYKDMRVVSHQVQTDLPLRLVA